MYNLSVVRIEAVERYHGRITLVRPSESRVSSSDPPLGWGDIAFEGVDVIWTSGDHETMFAEPNVSSFGKLLEEVLDKDSNGNDPVFTSSPGASDELLQISK